MRVVKWIGYAGVMGVVLMAIPWNLPGVIVLLVTALLFAPST